jgi:hypothetical protein
VKLDVFSAPILRCRLTDVHLAELADLLSSFILARRSATRSWVAVDGSL